MLKIKKNLKSGNPASSAGELQPTAYNLQPNKGFTLIELLVVIAIIGILSSVVLASLNSARGKGANSAVKANLSGIRAQAEVFYDNANPNVYTGVCSDGTVAAALVAADKSGAGANKCYADTDSWVISTELKITETGSLTHYCVDSSGKSKSITATQDTAITTANTLCP